jgi:hypothetical protein
VSSEADVDGQANPTGALAPPAPRSGFGRLYGARPWHLLALLACFALTAYTVSRLLDDLPALVRIAVWFVGAAIVWDLVLGPLYALADRGLRPLRSVAVRGVSPRNYVRVPALVSSLLLLVWAPVILQRSEQVFRLKAGLGQNVYLDRWAAVTTGLFALSALAFAVAVLRRGRAGAAGA